MKKVEETGNLVKEFMQGSVRVRIYDSAYVGKTQEDIDKILKRIGNIAMQNELQKMRRERPGV